MNTFNIIRQLSPPTWVLLLACALGAFLVLTYTTMSWSGFLCVWLASLLASLALVKKDNPQRASSLTVCIEAAASLGLVGFLIEMIASGWVRVSPSLFVLIDSLYYVCWTILILQTLSLIWRDSFKLNKLKRLSSSGLLVGLCLLIPVLPLTNLAGAIVNPSETFKSAILESYKGNSKARLVEGFVVASFVLGEPEKALNIAVNELDMTCLEANDAVNHIIDEAASDFVSHSDQYSYAIEMRSKEFPYSVSQSTVVVTLSNLGYGNFFDCLNPDVYISQTEGDTANEKL